MCDGKPATQPRGPAPGAEMGAQSMQEVSDRMDLSEREVRQLCEIGEDLSRSDPRLARSLSGRAGHRRSIRSLAWGLTMSCIVLEVAGALTRQSLVCAIAWLGATIGVCILLLAPRPSAPRGRLK